MSYSIIQHYLLNITLPDVMFHFPAAVEYTSWFPGRDKIKYLKKFDVRPSSKGKFSLFKPYL